MKFLIPILLFSLVTSIVLAQESNRTRTQRIFAKYAKGKDILFTIRTEDNGDIFLYLIKKDQVTASPTWDGNPPPPMSQMEAIRQGKEILAQRDEKAQNIALLSITLHKLHATEETNKWYYAISFNKKLAKDKPALSWEIYLLLDGTEIQPIKYIDE